MVAEVGIILVVGLRVMVMLTVGSSCGRDNEVTVGLTAELVGMPMLSVSLWYVLPYGTGAYLMADLNLVVPMETPFLGKNHFLIAGTQLVLFCGVGGWRCHECHPEVRVMGQEVASARSQNPARSGDRLFCAWSDCGRTQDTMAK